MLGEQSQTYCEDTDEMYMHLDQEKLIVPNIATSHLKKLDLRYCSYCTCSLTFFHLQMRIFNGNVKQ